MKKHITTILFIIYIVAVLALLLLPMNSVASVCSFKFLSIRGDHVIHACIMLPWMFLRPDRHIKMWVWLLMGFAFAGLIETTHYFLPYRGFEIEDMISNFAGIILGWGIHSLIVSISDKMR
ncbi:MAG: VanZ family protein [Bacteroidales bacterium]|nr:VanZ family protein [Bacteroidales bacterium]